LLAVSLISPGVAETTQKTGCLLAALKIPLADENTPAAQSPDEKTGGHRDAKWSLGAGAVDAGGIRAGSLPRVAAGQGRSGD
jgi:hypothetical protein